MTRFRIERLSKQYDRSTFSSGSPPLDSYFQRQVSQDARRRVLRCFVAVENDTEQITGFYTLSALSIRLDSLPEERQREVPRYPLIPAALIGRLAIDESYQGQGLGGVLLADAFLRVSKADVGVYAMLVDAKDEAAESFYQRFGFERFKGKERKLYLPIATALKLIGN